MEHQKNKTAQVDKITSTLDEMIGNIRQNLQDLINSAHSIEYQIDSICGKEAEKPSDSPKEKEVNLESTYLEKIDSLHGLTIKLAKSINNTHHRLNKLTGV